MNLIPRLCIKELDVSFSTSGHARHVVLRRLQSSALSPVLVETPRALGAVARGADPDSVLLILGTVERPSASPGIVAYEVGSGVSEGCEEEDDGGSEPEATADDGKGVLYCCGRRLKWVQSESDCCMQVMCGSCGRIYAMGLVGDP